MPTPSPSQTPRTEELTKHQLLLEVAHWKAVANYHKDLSVVKVIEENLSLKKERDALKAEVDRLTTIVSCSNKHTDSELDKWQACAETLVDSLDAVNRTWPEKDKAIDEFQKLKEGK